MLPMVSWEHVLTMTRVCTAQTPSLETILGNMATFSCSFSGIFRYFHGQRYYLPEMLVWVTSVTNGAIESLIPPSKKPCSTGCRVFSQRGKPNGNPRIHGSWWVSHRNLHLLTQIFTKQKRHDSLASRS